MCTPWKLFLFGGLVSLALLVALQPNPGGHECSEAHTHTYAPDPAPLNTIERLSLLNNRYRLYERLASQGYLVFCFDQLGMGSRVYETVNIVGQHQDRGTSGAWYDRPAHTEWSQLGKMVQDV